MGNTFIVRWPRLMAGICSIAGVALLYVIVDVHFLGLSIPGATETLKHSWLPNLFLGTMGILFFGMGISLLARPALLLEADPSGIKVYRAIGAKLRATERKITEHKGAICCIPWDKVSAIADGRAYWDGSSDAGKTVTESKALLIACHPSIRLEEYSWVGDVAVGLGPASPEECTMWPGSRLPGHENESQLILNSKYLPCSLSKAVKTLSDMKERYS